MDIRPDTLNLDEHRIEATVTPHTRAIVPVHYAGVACEMDGIMALAARYGLLVIEDAAQGIMATYQGRPLGMIGQLGTLSFHETKNIMSGERRRAAGQCPGTRRARGDRSREGHRPQSVLRGQQVHLDRHRLLLPARRVDRRLPVGADGKNGRRHYRATAGALGGLPCGLRAPGASLLLRDLDDRTRFIAAMEAAGIRCVFHYVLLHRSPQGRKVGRAHWELPATDRLANRLVLLPLWLGLENHQERIIAAANAILAG